MNEIYVYKYIRKYWKYRIKMSKVTFKMGFLQLLYMNARQVLTKRVHTPIFLY